MVVVQISFFFSLIVTKHLCDQFMMANGTLVRTLIHTDVTKYLSFKAVDGSFVFSKGKVNS
jgi:RAB protein geranylgeranyltransferase component A